MISKNGMAHEDSSSEDQPITERPWREDHSSMLHRIKQKREDFDQGRGIFTSSDRKFLFDEKEYDYKESEINKRRDIRKRVKNSIFDLQLLPIFSKSEREKLFSELDSEQLEESISSFLTFVYDSVGGNIESIEPIIEESIYRAEQNSVATQSRRIKNVDVNIDITYEEDIDEIYKRFMSEQKDDLTPAEIGVLVQEGRLKLSNNDENV